MAAFQPSQFALLDCFESVFQKIEQTLNQLSQTEQSQPQLEEAKFRSLFEQSADALMLADKGIIFDCNQAAVELFGWQDKTILPLHAAQLSPKYQPDGRPSFEKAGEMIALAQQNGNHRFEWMHRRHNGEDFWTEILLTQIELDGKPIQYTTLRNIHDRKQVEAKLREGERRFQAIFNQTFHLAGILSPDGILLEANQTALDVIAAQPEAVIGKRFWETAWWTHSPAIQQQLQQAIAQAKAGQAVLFEYDLPTADGKMIALEFSIKPITDHHGEVVMLIPEARDISDRKQAEITLREQEQFLRSIYDNVENFIFVVDVLPDGNFHYVDWNEAAERHSGLSSREIFGKTPEEIFGAIEGAMDRQNLTQCVQEKRAITVEENLTFQGQSTWWISTYNPLCDRDGRVHRIVGTSFNITERKRAEEALRQSEARFQSIAASLPGMIYQFRLCADGLRQFSYVSPSCLEHYGLEQAVFLNTPESVFALTHSDDRAAFEASLTKSAQTMQPWEHEYRIILPSGQVRWLQGNSQPEQQANGDIVWNGITIDISDRKQAEFALRQSREMLQLVIDTLPQIIGWKDRNSIFIGCNKAIAQIAGFDSPADMIGKSDYDMPWTPEETAGYLECDRRIMESGVAEMHIIEQQTQADGTVVWLDTSKIPLRDVDGNVIGILFAIEDITDRKRLEDERAQAEAALRYSEQRFRDVTEAAGEYIWELDAAGCYTFVSDRVKAVKGYEPAELVGRSPFECLVAEDVDRTQAILQEAVHNRSSFKLECRSIISSGEIVWEEVSGIPLTNSDGEIIGFRGTGLSITDRKQVEAELRKTQQQFQMLMDFTPAVIYIKDLAGRYIAISRQFCEMFQTTPEEIVGKIDDELFPAAIAHQLRENDRAVIASRSGITFEETILQPTGEHSYLATKFVFKDEQGNPYALCGISFDITDRKRAEEALRQQQLQLQTILDAVPSSIWLKDTKNKVLCVNAAAAAVVGRPANQIEGIFTSELFPQEAEAYYQDDLQVIRSGQPKLGIIEPQHSLSGEQRWIRTDKAPYRNSAGEIVGLVAVATDITDRKRAEIALRESEQQLREQAQRERLLNQLTQQIRNSLDFDIALSTALTETQAILGVDRCQFAWYYPNAEEPYWEAIQEVRHPDLPDLTGCYPASAVGLLANKLLQLERLSVADVKTVSDPIWQAFMRSVQIRSVLIIPMQMPSGTIGVISCSYTNKSHHWETDEIELLEAVMGQLAIALNQAELYAQSRAKAHELEQTLHQLQRTQAQMLQSEKMSSLGQLVAGVAHEINNPVNFIYGNLNYASDYIEDLLGLVKLYQQQYPQPVAAVEAQAEAIDLDFLIADLPKLLNSMKVGANRIQKIVASLRTFSRMDEAEVKSVNIHEGIDSTLLILQHRIKKRDDRGLIEIVKQYADLPPIECYAGQLNQVFMNLLSNAIDALEDALKVKANLIPTITIQTKRIDRFVTIEVTDNGLGIPESIRQRLFDPFFTTKPLGKGTGMGLSISYQIVVEKHNGSIDCLSSEAGTTFTVKIPVLPSPSAGDRARTADKPAKSGQEF